MIDEEERKALEAAGMRVTTIGEFLDLTPEEEELIELRVAVSIAARKARLRQSLTQSQLARRIKSTQARVAKVEAGSPDVSLDLMFRSLFAAGGSLADVIAPKRKPLESRPPTAGKRLGSK